MYSSVEDMLEVSDMEVFTAFDKVTIVAIRLPNGFVVSDSAGAIDKKDFDKDIGTQVALEKIFGKVQELEGYAKITL